MNIYIVEATHYDDPSQNEQHYIAAMDAASAIDAALALMIEQWGEAEVLPCYDLDAYSHD